MKKIIIIGAGFGGLASAALLAKQGYSVLVLEKNSKPGGRAMTFEQDGFLFDMGPSWYLMPDVFERYFALFNKKSADFYTLQRLDPSYRIFFSKDEQVDIRKDKEKNYEIFEKIEKGSSIKFKELLKISEENYKIAIDDFVYKNYRNFFDFFQLQLLVKGSKLHVFESFDKYMSRFFKSDKLKKILQYTVVFLGGSPKNTPALYAIMTHVDFNLGVWYPQGGMNKIHEALVGLGNENNVTYQYDASVEKIIVENGKSVGVQVNGKIIPADIIVSNADYPFTETKLLEEKYQTYKEEKWQKMIIAPSAFIIYLGIKGKVANLEHHNLFFAHDWEKHFDDIFHQRKQWPENPSYYICVPSKTDSTVAPESDENVFVLVPIAPGLEDTVNIRNEYYEKVIKHIEEITGETISDRILVKKIHTINDYKKLYNAYQGTALGLAHNLMQSAVFRPGNKSKKVSNLYYVGQYTVPGVGVPMCLISAQLVAERIQSEHRS